MLNYKDWSFKQTINFWKKNADSDGWISKKPEQIADQIDNAEDRMSLLEILSMTKNYFNTEWENNSEKRWKFREDDLELNQVF